MATFLSGKDGKASFDAVDLNITGWSMDRNIDALETTHSGSSGIESNIGGIKRYSGNVAADFDSDAAPSDASPNVVEGETATLKLYTDSTKFYQIDVLVTKLNIASEVAGKVTYNFDWVGTGAVTERA